MYQLLCKIACSDDIFFFFFQKETLTYIWFTMCNLETGALAEHFGKHIVNNQWIYYHFRLDTYFETAIKQQRH